MSIASGFSILGLFIVLVLIAIPVIIIIVIALSKSKDSGTGMKNSSRQKVNVKVISKRTQGNKNYAIFELPDSARIELIVNDTDFANLREGDNGILDYNGERFKEFELV